MQAGATKQLHGTDVQTTGIATSVLKVRTVWNAISTASMRPSKALGTRICSRSVLYTCGRQTIDLTRCCSRQS